MGSRHGCVGLAAHSQGLDFGGSGGGELGGRSHDALDIADVGGIGSGQREKEVHDRDVCNGKMWS